MDGVTQSLPVAGRMPLMLERNGAASDAAQFVSCHREAVAELLLRHGALLFRGFHVSTVRDFERFVDAVSSERLDYIYGSTPRSAVAQRIFTATEYPASQEIPLHSENSYRRDWPLKLALCCLTPARDGGETPLADLRLVTQRIVPELLERFSQRGVRYVRHYHRYIDLPWQKVFQTQDPATLTEYCEAHDITYEWVGADVLRTEQVAQGTAVHPATGERCIFNQAHLFHVTSLGERATEAMVEHFGADRLPRQSYYGDGGEIPAADLQLLRHAYSSSAVQVPWRQGDMLLLDNMQAAHGRRTFVGPREVVVALMDSWSPSAERTRIVV